MSMIDIKNRQAPDDRERKIVASLQAMEAYVASMQHEIDSLRQDVRMLRADVDLERRLRLGGRR